MLLINIIIILYEWSKASLATLFWAVVFLLFSVPHIIHAYGDDYSERTIFQVTLFAVIFMCCYLAVRFLYFSSGRRGEGSIDSNLLIHEDRRFVDFIFAVYFVCFLIIAFCFYRGGGSIMTAMAYVSYGTGMIEKIASITLVALSGIGCISFLRKEYLRFLICVAIYGFYFLTNQIRYNLIGFFAPFMIFFLFNTSRRKRTVGITLGVLFVVFVYFAQQLRWAGGMSNALNSGFGVLMENTINYMKSGNGEFGLIKAFYYFVEHDNAFDGFGRGLGFIRLALIILPASLVPFKPRDFAIDMYREWFRIDNPAGTMHPTIFGDAYANFGFWGCLTGAFYGLIMIFADEHMNSCSRESVKVLKISLISTMMIILARGAVYNSIFNCILGLALVFVLERVFLLRNPYENDACKRCENRV